MNLEDGKEVKGTPVGHEEEKPEIGHDLDAEAPANEMKDTKMNSTLEDHKIDGISVLPGGTVTVVDHETGTATAPMGMDRTILEEQSKKKPPSGGISYGGEAQESAELGKGPKSKVENGMTSDFSANEAIHNEMETVPVPPGTTSFGGASSISAKEPINDESATAPKVPLTVLLRSTYIGPPPSRPGAFPSAGTKSTIDPAEDQEDNVADVNDNVVDTVPVPIIVAGGLVQAREVKEDGARLQLPSAEPVDPSPQGNTEKKEEWKKHLFFLLLGLVILVGLGVAIGLPIQANKTTRDAPVSDSTTPTPTVQQSMEPSEVPSIAPTGVLDDLLIMLPDQTLKNLGIFGTPQNMAWSWLQEHEYISDKPQWRKVQLFALAAFFYAFEGEDWVEPIRERWLVEDQDECDWFSSGYGSFYEENGVYKYHPWDRQVPPCNEFGEFTSLYVQDLNMSGLQPSIPAEMNLMTSLKYIDLSWNSIDVALADLLATEIFQMSQLRDLVLYVNHISGTIPTELFLLANMTNIQLSQNELTGSLPSELGLLKNLTSLGVMDNRLIGTLPTQLGVMSNLGYLSVGGETNLITGTIPSELGQLQLLLYMELSGLSLLTGFVPSELSSVESLGHFWVDGCTNLTGAMPEELCFLQSSFCTYANWLRTENCSLKFDCGNLCGCDCPCSNASTVLEFVEGTR